MNNTKAFLKLGKGLFGKGNREVTKEDLLIINSEQSSSENPDLTKTWVKSYVNSMLLDNTVNKIISAGGFTWVKDWEYKALSYTYKIKGEVYSSPIKTITLEDAGISANENRTDAVVLTYDEDDNGAIIVKKGEFGPGFKTPEIDSEREILLTTIDVPNGATQPKNITEVVIYDEDDAVLNIVEGSVVSSLDNPYSQTKNLAVTDFTTGDSFTLKTATDFNPKETDNLLFAIRTTSGEWKNNGTIKIALINAADNIVSNTITIASKSYTLSGNPYSFNSKAEGWQIISIPKSALSPTTENARGVLIFKDDGLGTDSFNIDLVRLQVGTGAVDTSLFITEAPIDGKSYYRKDGDWYEVITVDTGNLQKEVTSDYTIVGADNKYTIFFNSATPITITIDTVTTPNFECDFYNLGAGEVTFTDGTATVGYPDGTTLEKDKVCALLKVLNTTTYKLKGELE